MAPQQVVVVDVFAHLLIHWSCPMQIELTAVLQRAHEQLLQPCLDCYYSALQLIHLLCRFQEVYSRASVFLSVEELDLAEMEELDLAEMEELHLAEVEELNFAELY